MVDLADPARSTLAGCFSDHGCIHDTQCVTYEGPDAQHRGREICFNSAATFLDFTPEGIINTVSAVDVTDKDAPISLDRVEYPTTATATRAGGGPRDDVDRPQALHRGQPGLRVQPHLGTAHLRHQQRRERRAAPGRLFDLYPENDAATFEGGTWSNYPYHAQKVVAVSSMDRGLFVLTPRGSTGS